MSTLTLPIVSAITAGVILLLLMVLMINVGRHRGRSKTLLGEGSDPALLRAIRVHANLAENAAAFLVGFALLEMLGGHPLLVASLCGVFVAARLAHAIGLSRTEAPNAGRFLGALGTLLVGLITAAALIWTGAGLLMN